MDKSIRDAIAKIEVIDTGADGRVLSRGTGFLVGENLVLTALHVVADRRSDPPRPIPGTIVLHFPGGSTEALMDKELWDASEDWALLHCKDPVSAKSLPIGEARDSGEEFETYGFPDANPRDGMVQTGTVENHQADLDGVSAYQLFSKQASAGKGAPVKGLSGGPVIIGGAVVGLMRFALMDKQQATVAGTVYACPLMLITERTGNLLPIPDPCQGLPGLPRRDLPTRPFRYLERFMEPQAEIFFGRNREIRQLYDLINNEDAPPIIFLFGETGVGKSSFLDAGVLPRLSWNYEVLYLRRSQHHSMVETLMAALEKLAGSAHRVMTLERAWHAIEERSGKSLILLFDQAEEIFTRPIASGENELETLSEVLASVFSGDRNVNGRLILSFRKEWFPDFHKQLAQRDLGHGNVFLEALDQAAVIEVINGLISTSRLRTGYSLKLEEGLDVMIADDLVADRESSVAPVLQVLLTRMWEVANEQSPGQPHFTRELYLDLKNQGYLLDDFVGHQLDALKKLHPQEVKTGLVLDLLAFHITSMSTSAERQQSVVYEAYSHTREKLPALLNTLIDHYLLTGAVLDNQDGSTRLAHDTLGPVIKHRIHWSRLPGQRAQLVLASRSGSWKGEKDGEPLDEWDLGIVEKGLNGMCALEPEETRMLEASRRERSKRKLKTRFWKAVGVASILIIIGTAVWALNEKQKADRQRLETELSRTTDQVARYLITEPITALMIAIQAIGKSYEVFDGRIDPELRFSLNQAVNESWELHQVNHGAAVTAVAVHPSGKAYASAGEDDIVRLWKMPPTTSERLRDSMPMASLSAPMPVPEMLPENPTQAFEFKAHINDITGLEFTPDGKFMVTSSLDATVRLWDLLHATTRILPGPDEPMAALAISLDGSLIVAAAETGRIYTWDGQGEPVSIGTPMDTSYFIFASIHIVPATYGVVTAIAISPDASRIVTGHDNGQMLIWSPGIETEPNIIEEGHRKKVTAIEFHPDGGEFTSASTDETIYTWDLEGIWLGESRTNSSPVLSIAYRGDGKALVSGGEDNLVLLTDVRLDNSFGDLLAPPFRGIDGAINALAITPDNQRIVVGSADGTVRLADWLSSQVDLPRYKSSLIEHLVISDDALKVNTVGQGYLGHWCSQEFTRITGGTLNGELSDDCSQSDGLLDDEDLLLLGVARGAQILITSVNGGFKIKDLEAGTELTIPVTDGEVQVIAVSPDGDRLAYATANHVIIVDTKNGATYASLQTHGSSFRFLEFSADGRTLAGAEKSCVTIWDLVKPQVIVGGTGIGNKQGPTPDTVNSLNAGTKRCAEDFDITALAIANRGNEITVGTSKGRIHFWRRADGKITETAHHKAHNDPISDLVFRPDSLAVMSVGKSKMGLWSIHGKQYAQFSTPDQQINSIRFGADGQVAVSASLQPNADSMVSVIRVWATHWGEWLSVGCHRLEYHPAILDPADNLTQTEKEWVFDTRAVCEKFANPDLIIP